MLHQLPGHLQAEARAWARRFGVPNDPDVLTDEELGAAERVLASLHRRAKRGAA